MKTGNLLSLIILCWLLFAGCKKDSSARCQDFKQAMVDNNLAFVRDQITETILRLRQRDHTTEGLTGLAHSISNQCDITASVVCFSCIQTNPGQSEIRLSFSLNGSTVQKTIDISSTSTQDNKMKLVNMHD